MSAVLKQLFSKYLIITNTVTSGTLLGLGDVITQGLEAEYASRAGNVAHQFDIHRTGICTRASISNCCLRPRSLIFKGQGHWNRQLFDHESWQSWLTLIR